MLRSISPYGRGRIRSRVWIGGEGATGARPYPCPGSAWCSVKTKAPHGAPCEIHTRGRETASLGDPSTGPSSIGDLRPRKQVAYGLRLLRSQLFTSAMEYPAFDHSWLFDCCYGAAILPRYLGACRLALKLPEFVAQLAPRAHPGAAGCFLGDCYTGPWTGRSPRHRWAETMPCHVVGKALRYETAS
jgi:hypothetical protein